MSLQEKIVAYVEGQAIPDPTECFAVPGMDHIIDVINPTTNKTAIYGRTLEEVRQQPGNEKAERMTIERYCREKAARQDAGFHWQEIDEREYDYLFECLPPILYGQLGFLVGETYDHHALTGRPRYTACIRRGSRFFRSSRPLTVQEFRDLPK